MAVRKLYGEKRRGRIRNVQLDGLRDLLGIRRMDRMPNSQVREMYEVTKVMDDRIDESVSDIQDIFKVWGKIGLLMNKKRFEFWKEGRKLVWCVRLEHQFVVLEEEQMSYCFFVRE